VGLCNGELFAILVVALLRCTGLASFSGGWMVVVACRVMGYG